MTTTTKQCTHCKLTKPLSEFGKNKRNKDLHQYYCKECGRKSSAKWRTEEGNRDKYVSYAKDYYKSNKSQWKGYANAPKPYVYRITHKTNGDYYIGCSAAKFEHRICRHFTPGEQNNSPFRGKDKNDYEFTIIVFTENKIKAREIEKDLLSGRVKKDAKCLNIRVGGK